MPTIPSYSPTISGDAGKPSALPQSDANQIGSESLLALTRGATKFAEADAQAEEKQKAASTQLVGELAGYVGREVAGRAFSATVADKEGVLAPDASNFEDIYTKHFNNLKDPWIKEASKRYPDASTVFETKFEGGKASNTAKIMEYKNKYQIENKDILFNGSVNSASGIVSNDPYAYDTISAELHKTIDSQRGILSPPKIALAHLAADKELAASQIKGFISGAELSGVGFTNAYKAIEDHAAKFTASERETLFNKARTAENVYTTTKFQAEDNVQKQVLKQRENDNQAAFKQTSQKISLLDPSNEAFPQQVAGILQDIKLQSYRGVPAQQIALSKRILDNKTSGTDSEDDPIALQHINEQLSSGGSPTAAKDEIYRLSQQKLLSTDSAVRLLGQADVLLSSEGKVNKTLFNAGLKRVQDSFGFERDFVTGRVKVRPGDEAAYNSAITNYTNLTTAGPSAFRKNPDLAADKVITQAHGPQNLSPNIRGIVLDADGEKAKNDLRRRRQSEEISGDEYRAALKAIEVQSQERASARNKKNGTGK